MKRASVVAMSIAAALVTMTAACDAPEDEKAPEPEAPLVMRGVFVADEAERAGGIDEIELRGTRYRLLADGCNDIECEEQGRFEHDVARAELHLTPDRSGIRYTLAFETSTRSSRPKRRTTAPTRPSPPSSASSRTRSTAALRRPKRSSSS